MKRFILLAAGLGLFAPAALSLEIRGAVVDSAGKPVNGANLWLCQDLDVAVTETDESGAFVFQSLRPERATIVAKKDGYSLGGVEVHAPGVGPVAIVLGEPAPLVVEVKDEMFAPLPGARVTSLVLNGVLAAPVGLFSDQSNFPPLFSNDDGLLELVWAPRGGAVSLVLSHRTHATAFAPFLSVDAARLPVQMYRGARVRGRISAPDAPGVPQAQAAFFNSDAASLGEPLREPVVVTADPEGFYNVIVRPGDYHVAARHAAYASPQPVRVSLYGGHNEQAVLNLELETPHIVEGKVQLPDGRPCPNIPVTYLVQDSVYAETLTQRDGSFRFLAPDKEALIRVVAPPGFMTANYFETPIRGRLPERIELTPVQLLELPVIEGTVKGADGSPAAHALVASTGLLVEARAITDADGRFKLGLIQAPPEGRVRFRAEHALRFQRAEFEVDFANPEPVNISLTPFEPDLDAQPPQPAENDLADMLHKRAPAIDCADWLNTAPISLEELEGKVVVLAFWGGFDDRPEAVDVIDELRAVDELYKPAGDVAVLAIHDSGTDTEHVREYLEAFNIGFKVGRDTPPGQTFAKYRVRYIPQVVVLDKNGNLRHFQTRGRLLELIKSLRRE